MHAAMIKSEAASQTRAFMAATSAGLVAITLDREPLDLLQGLRVG